jgi:hypothetical protein
LDFWFENIPSALAGFDLTSHEFHSSQVDTTPLGRQETFWALGDLLFLVANVVIFHYKSHQQYILSKKQQGAASLIPVQKKSFFTAALLCFPKNFHPGLIRTRVVRVH